VLHSDNPLKNRPFCVKLRKKPRHASALPWFFSVFSIKNSGFLSAFCSFAAVVFFFISVQFFVGRAWRR
jgi:hypothetical protein